MDGILDGILVFTMFVTILLQIAYLSIVLRLVDILHLVHPCAI